MHTQRAFVRVSEGQGESSLGLSDDASTLLVHIR